MVRLTGASLHVLLSVDDDMYQFQDHGKKKSEVRALGPCICALPERAKNNTLSFGTFTRETLTLGPQDLVISGFGGALISPKVKSRSESIGSESHHQPRCQRLVEFHHHLCSLIAASAQCFQRFAAVVGDQRKPSM